MKRKLLVPIFLVPFLISCNGLSISIDDAKIRIANIKNNISINVPFNYYQINQKVTSSTLSSENFYRFSRDDKYYYAYSILTEYVENKIVNQIVHESWVYVKANSDKEINIYNIERIISDDMKMTDHPRYKILSKQSYSFDVWASYDSLFISQAITTFNHVLDNSLKIIDENSQKNNLIIYSHNVKSYFLKNVTNEETIEYEFYNNGLISNNLSTKESSTKESWNYDKFEILYPNENYIE